MNFLIVYFTQTGNTRKVAEAIYKALEGNKEIKSLDQVADWEGYDLIFVGFPIIAFGPAPQAKESLKKFGSGKKIALFITHASPEGEEALEEWLGKCRQAAVEAGAQLVGMFHCQGELSAQIAEFLVQSDDPRLRSFGLRRAETLGQPDPTRLERAGRFARDLEEKMRNRVL